MGSPTAFSVQVRDAIGAVRLHLVGRFDRSALPALEHALTRVLGRNVMLDFGEVTFMDGAAWLGVMDCEHRVHASGHRLEVANTAPRIRTIFERTQTEHLLSDARRADERRDDRGRLPPPPT